jgi:flagellar FliJ protein
MKKYSFKFESLLNIRNLQEEEAERAFREAAMRYEEELGTLNSIKEDFRRTLEDLANQRQAGFDARIQSLYDVYFKHLKNRIASQTKIVDKAEKAMEERREELVEAMKERKVVEKLKVRDYEKYAEELKRWEQAIVDDLAVLRHNSEMATGRSVS